jgi:hypothetical protein
MNPDAVGVGVVTDGWFYVTLAYSVALGAMTLYALSLFVRARNEENP